mmetsp:Transcript_4814/g.13961  ORF Transcript_4814/g.13961 Transcript_4814/m.13961 type:complete len:222 (+) Transcript_4814:1945-2610(+)
MQPGAHVAWASAAAPPSGARLRAHAAPPARPSAERGAGHGAVRAASAPTAGGPARESGSPRRRRAAPAHIASRPRSPRRLSRRASLRPRHEQHPAAAIRVHSRCHGPAAADAPAVPWRARQEPELGQLVQVRQVRYVVCQARHGTRARSPLSGHPRVSHNASLPRRAHAPLHPPRSPPQANQSEIISAKWMGPRPAPSALQQARAKAQPCRSPCGLATRIR